MIVKVLGPGCWKCKKLKEETEKAIAESGVSAEIVKVEDMDAIMAYGIMMTPGIVVDDVVKASGRIARSSEIAVWLKEAAGKQG
jgi:small redox-active disulfide protein 2